MEPSARPAAPTHYDATGRVFILLCLGASLWFSWKVIQPFLTAIAFAAIIDVVFFPVFHSLTRRFGGRRRLAAGVTVLIVVICVLIPLAAMGLIFTKQALQLYETVGQPGAEGGLVEILRLRDWGAVEAWIAKNVPWVDAQNLNLKNLFLSLIAKVSGSAVAIGTAVAQNVLTALGTFAVMLFCLFFFLLDGLAFLQWLSALSPLNDKHERTLMDTFVAITKSGVIGSGVIAVAQGVIGGLAFWAVGFPGVLWGFVMGCTSVVPVVGAAIVWVPAGLILLAQGRVAAGIGILLWGAIVISSADNVIRMFVVKGPVRIHPLLIFFSVLGGISVAGFLGIFLGPLVIALLLALLEIYRVEFVGPPPPAACTTEEEP